MTQDKYPVLTDESLQGVIDWIKDVTRLRDSDTGDYDSLNEVLLSTISDAEGHLDASNNLSDVDSASTSLTNLGVSAFAQTLIDDADSATARATLEIGQTSLMSYGGYHFDGSTHYIDGNLLTGITDTKTGSIFVAVRFEDAAGTLEIICGSSGDYFRMDRAADGDIIFRLENSAGTVIGSIYTTDLPCAAAGTYLILASWDLSSSGSSKIYVNGVDRTVVEGTFTDDTINYTATDFTVGGRYNGTFLWEGDLYTLWFDETTALDFDDADVRAKFHDTSNVLVPLGYRGDNPTGTSPILYLGGSSFDTWHINKGRGTGGFTEHGTPAAVTTELQGYYSERLVISPEYTPTLAGGDQFAFNHGLGHKPSDIHVVLRCKTASEGYAVGDEVQCMVNDGATGGYSFHADDTQVTVNGNTTGSAWQVVNNSDSSVDNITVANWKVVIYVYG